MLTAPLNITTAQLAYLAAALEHDTWAAAADSLGVSASALSQGLAELQRRLGVELFERDGRQLRPRSEAFRVAEHAQLVLAATADLIEWAEQTRSGSTGRVAVGMIDAAAIDWFGDTLRQWRAANAEIDLQLMVAPSGQLVDRLRTADLDLIVCVDHDGEQLRDLATTPLLTEPLFVFAPPGQERRPPAQWGPWVSFPGDSHTRRVVQRALLSAGATYEVSAESSQPEVLREMVLLGVGWAVLPRVRTPRQIEQLVPARRSPLVSRQLVLAQRRGRRLTAAEQSLATQLAAAASTATGISTS